MARAESRQNGLRTIDGSDDVEKSLELLDKVLSEFEEEPETSPPGAEPESPSQGHQSEDDGYMSMNGRRAKFVPDFQPTDEAPQPPPLPVPPDEKCAEPPSPEEAERIITNLLPRLSPNRTSVVVISNINSTSNSCREQNEINNEMKRKNLLNRKDITFSSDETGALGEPQQQQQQQLQQQQQYPPQFVDLKSITSPGTTGTTAPSQTTLPKTRPASVFPSRYASLPCTSPPKLLGPNDTDAENCTKDKYGVVSEQRNVLGIGISAIQDAVLRGITRMPEPIVNEHPVTIYPGSKSPPRRVPPRTLPGSIERHREVCRKNFANERTSSDERSSQENLMILGQATTAPLNYYHQQQQQQEEQGQLSAAQSPTRISPHGVHINISYNNHLTNNQIFTNFEIGKKSRNSGISDDDRFSDDSLEDTSLPPPPPPPVVPPPPSLSAPVTPSKRHSIAWEVNLDDPASFGDPLSVHNANNGNGPGNTKVINRRRGRSVSGSQSSVASTPGHSLTSNNRKSGSSEWPEPPDNIPICSTEDEAQSIYSDSDDLIPHPIDNGRGTYVIRKGRKQRQRLADMDSLSSINSRLSNEDSISNVPSPVFPASMILPKSRHSIDLGSSTSTPAPTAPVQNSLNSPRSRLSLDLNSPTSELPATTATVSTNNLINNNTIKNSICVNNISLNSSHNNLNSNINNINSSNSNHNLNNNINNGIPAIPAVVATSNGSNINNNISANLSNNNSLNQNGSGVSTCSNNSNTVNGNSTNTNNNASNNNNNNIISPRYMEFKTYSSTFDGLQALENSNNNINRMSSSNSTINELPLMRVASLPTITPPMAGDVLISTPRRELAPPIEEDEEVDSDTQRERTAPLRQIENNISALLRGDIAVARVGGDVPPPRRPLGFRPGVHKSESAKEMLLSQNLPFGPLPASPPSSSPELDSDEFPPLPPSPTPEVPEVIHGVQNFRISSRSRLKVDSHHVDHPPMVPPHRGPSLNTLKTRSMDAGFSKSYRNGSFVPNSPHGPGTLPPDLPNSTSRRRLISSGFPKRAAQSPREERRLQTSCSLPETPIFARGCDIPRTPHRRAPDIPSSSTGSRTAPRHSTPGNNMNSSIVGIGSSTIGIGVRQRSISQALANGEMLRLAGGPARGWYPRQRSARPASTENLDRLHQQGSLRAWGDHSTAGMGSRKPLTLPPNLTPKFFNKSPREALRRVTSLLIRKGNGSKDKETKKERDKEKEFLAHSVNRSPGSIGDDVVQHQQQQQQLPQPPVAQKKKGFFKSFWKKSRHYSLEQQ